VTRDQALDTVQRNIASVDALCENTEETREALHVLKATHPLRPLGVTAQADGFEEGGFEREASTSPRTAERSAPTPVSLSGDLPRDWDFLPILARTYPEAVAVRSFQYAKPDGDFPELSVPCLHVEMAGGVCVIPLEPLSCDVRCDFCRGRPQLKGLCPGCNGTKRRRSTVADVQHFVDAGERYGMSGTYWRMAPLGAEDALK